MHCQAEGRMALAFSSVMIPSAMSIVERERLAIFSSIDSATRSTLGMLIMHSDIVIENVILYEVERGRALAIFECTECTLGLRLAELGQRSLGGSGFDFSVV